MANNMPVSDGIEESLWESAVELRGQVEPSEYKHIVLGLLFLRDASLRFEQEKEAVESEYPDLGDEERKKVLRSQLTSEGSFYIPEEARWDNIRNSNKNISEALDDAMEAIENAEGNEKLKNRLPKRYQQANVKTNSLEKLMDKFEKIDIREDEETDSDFVGRIYEYFIKQFAINQAQGSGEFYTPQDIVELLVETIKPLKGDIFDPCAGTGGMFVQSYEYANEKQTGKSLNFHGQEISSSSISLAEMNMFLRNLSEQVTLREGDSLTNDRFDGLKADKVITNPPFNYTYNPDEIDDDDPRFPYGLPNAENANYAFVQHMLHHTKEGGLVGTVMANGALANSSDESIREGLVEDDLVDVVITLPEKLFYTVDIPVSIFIFSKGKGEHNEEHRNRQNETLFVDASDLYKSVSRSENRLTDDHIQKISETVRKYRGDYEEEEIDEEDYQDVEEFCKVATSDEIADTNYNLNPGRYISFDTDTDYTPLDVRLPELRGQLEAKFKQSRELEENIMNQLSKLEQNEDEEDEQQDTTQGDTE